MRNTCEIYVVKLMLTAFLSNCVEPLLNYENIVLTDDIEFYIIEIPKFKKYMNDTALADWVKFIINPKVINMENEEVKKAKEVLDELSQNEHERRLAELREKYIMDQKATEAAGYDKGMERGLEEGLERGMKRGLSEGLERGKEQGARETKIELAKKLKDRGVDINLINETTGLSIEEINNL